VLRAAGEPYLVSGHCISSARSISASRGVSALATTLDLSALVVAGIEGVPAWQAHVTFAIARHTADRSDAGALRADRLRSRSADRRRPRSAAAAALEDAGLRPARSAEADARLAELPAVVRTVHRRPRPFAHDADPRVVAPGRCQGQLAEHAATPIRSASLNSDNVKVRFRRNRSAVPSWTGSSTWAVLQRCSWASRHDTLS